MTDHIHSAMIRLIEVIQAPKESRLASASLDDKGVDERLGSDRSAQDGRLHS